jgi:DNA-binding YbaB/EbfC family protein
MNVEKLLQRALSELEVEGSAGGGLVRVRLSGLKELKGVKIDAKALAGEEASLVEDLVVAAWQEASRLVDEKTRDLLARMGLPSGVPGLL